MRKSSWSGGISAFERSILDKNEVKAPEEAADGKAALGKDSTREAPYEQRVEAWAERFGSKAHESRATKSLRKLKQHPQGFLERRVP